MRWNARHPSNRQRPSASQSRLSRRKLCLFCAERERAHSRTCNTWCGNINPVSASLIHDVRHQDSDPRLLASHPWIETCTTLHDDLSPARKQTFRPQPSGVHFVHLTTCTQDSQRVDISKLGELNRDARTTIAVVAVSARKSDGRVVRTRAVCDFQKSPTLEVLEGIIGHPHAPQGQPTAGWTCLYLKPCQNLKIIGPLQHQIRGVLLHVRCTSPEQC